VTVDAPPITLMYIQCDLFDQLITLIEKKLYLSAYAYISISFLIDHNNLSTTHIASKCTRRDGIEKEVYLSDEEVELIEHYLSAEHSFLFQQQDNENIHFNKALLIISKPPLSSRRSMILNLKYDVDLDWFECLTPDSDVFNIPSITQPEPPFFDIYSWEGLSKYYKRSWIN